MAETPLVLGGRYEVGELIGRGGMAEVHAGRDARLGRVVAIKMLRPDLARDPSFQARFRREAQAAAGLNHPSIVAVYDSGEEDISDAGSANHLLPYIVMEYVEGHTVRELLGDGDPVPIKEAAEITVGTLNALEYSHREGIVHRDIKPGNIMLTPTGDVKVMDFGIARALSDNSATMTAAHSVVGTAQYLSPEQARGEAVDARSDLYSTGCLLYELLTGRPPFSGDSAVAVAYQHVREVPRLPSELAPDIPEAFDRVVMKALAKEREDRYSTAAEFRTDLLAAARGLDVAAPPTASWATGAAGASLGAAGAAGASTAPLAAQGVTAIVPTAGPPTGSPVAPPVAGSSTTAVQGARRGPAPVQTEQPRRSWGWLVVLLLALLAVGGLVTYLVVNQDEEPAPMTTTTVPALEGLDEAGVRAELTEARLTPNFIQEESADVPAGLFLRSDPPPGREVEVDSAVNVVMSAGAGQVTVPDVSGMTQDQARQALADSGLSVGNVDTVDSAEEPEGRVIGTDPGVNTSVPAGTSVTLVVASGLVELPDLTGETEEDAQAVLDGLNLNSSVVGSEYDPDVAEGRVLRQSPGAGLVEQQQTVDLVLSQGPEPTPEPTPEPSPEPTTEPSPTQPPPPPPAPTEAPTEGPPPAP